VLFGLFDPLADKEVRHHAENENAHVATAGLVIEEHAGGKQEGVTEQNTVLDQGEDGKHHGEETPEVKLRKQQGTVRVKRKRSSKIWYQVIQHKVSS
jgi:hypothetical protein